MPDLDEQFLRENFTAILDRLMEHGWISSFGFHKNGGYALAWTEKGKMRARWLKEMESELDLGPKGMTALLVICHLHAPSDQEAD